MIARCVTVGLALVLLSGCTKSSSFASDAAVSEPTDAGSQALPAPDSGAPAASGVAVDSDDGREAFAVGSSPELKGQKVERTTDGPWELRRAGGGNAGIKAMGAVPSSAGAVRRSRALLDSVGMAAAPSAPAPMAEGRVGVASRAKRFAEGAPAANPLRAGSTDDNADFDAFLRFLSTWSDKPNLAQSCDLVDVRDRRWLKVVDSSGKPVPAALVQVVDLEHDKLLWAGTTYGDGRLPFYSRAAAARLGATQLSERLVVQVAQGEARARADWTGAADLVVALPTERGSSRLALDVVFAIDTTGSMGDEIQRIKETLAAVTRKLVGLDQEFDLRYGAVLFRDLGDLYVTSTHPFTSDLEAFGKALQQVGAAGGGDGPESVNQALAELTRLDWREGAAKVAFLIGDAPPHMDYEGDVPYGQSALAALAQGIRIHSVAASGLDGLGTLVFRQVAQLTRGKFIFIEYGSTAASAERHGVTGSVSSNNLDDIIFAQIRDEIAHWGREAPPAMVSEK